MFYLLGRKGAFLAGHVSVSEPGYVWFEGFQSKGVTKKFEASADTYDDAWDRLCALVVDAKADNYIDGDLADAKVVFSHESFQGVFPERLRSVYAVVEHCDAVHFQAGASRLEEVAELVKTHTGIEVLVSERLIRMKHGNQTLQFGLADLRSWEAMSNKGRELCEEKGFVDAIHLLPSGMGLWHIQTQESVLDVCIRAFMAGAIASGAKISFRSDCSWLFSEGLPFFQRDVKDLAWVKAYPSLQFQLASNVTVAPAMSDDDFAEAFMFL